MLETLIALIAARSALELYTDVDVGAYRLNVPALFGLAMLALAASLLVQRRRAVLWHPLLWGWAAWLAALLSSVFIGFSLHGREGFFGVREWVRLLSIPAVFLVAYNVAPDRRRRHPLDLLLFVLAVPLAAAMVQMVIHTGLADYGQHRVMGTLFHPNSLALFLVFFLGLSYWKARSSGHWAWLLLIAGELVVFVATLSLNGLMMLLALGAWIFLREETRGRRVLLAMGVFLALLIASNGQARDKMQAIRSFAPAKIRQSVKEGKYVDSLGWRYRNWAELISVWRTRPLLGWGLNATQFVNPEKASGVGYAPHNDLLRYLVETGIIGLLGYVAFAGFCAYQMLRAAWPPGASASPAWILTGVFLAAQAGSLGDNVIANTVFQVCLWSAWGFELRRQRVERSRVPRD